MDCKTWKISNVLFLIVITFYVKNLKAEEHGSTSGIEEVPCDSKEKSDFLRLFGSWTEDSSNDDGSDLPDFLNDDQDPFDAFNEYRRLSPYSGQTTPDFIRKAGYPVESHEVHTKDGYIITIHRIPSSKRSIKDSQSNIRRKVVLIQHGFLCTSSDWIMHPPEKALPYMLVDTGLYDVWLGNIRGNKYAASHEKLRTEDNNFWTFSYHEAAEYDVTAMINYILNYSGQEKLFYVGHSMGNNIIFAALAMYPEYNSKLEMIFSLAPAPFLKHIRSPIKLLAPLTIFESLFLCLKHFNQGDNAIIEFGTRELDLSLIHKLLHHTILTCPMGSIFMGLCNHFSTGFGLDIRAVNKSWIPVLITQYPDTSSAKTLVHFLQGMNSGLFANYDYGRIKNMHVYGHRTPPNYNLSNVRTPVSVFWAEDDAIISPKDIEVLLKSLPNVVYNIKVDSEYFNHGGFLYGLEADKKVYAKIMEIMNYV